MLIKVILLRNEKTGAWKYTKMDVKDFKKSSWPGYDYYGAHRTVADAMIHATNIINDDARKLNEERNKKQLPVIFTPKMTTMRDGMEMWEDEGGTVIN
jgi:hypothetical protein